MKKQNFLIRNSSNGWNCTISELKIAGSFPGVPGLFSALLTVAIMLMAAYNSFAQTKTYRSDRLELIPLNQHLYVHISWLRTDDFGKVPCNGLVYINKGGAYIFDSPTNDTASRELIRVLQKKWKLKIQGVVATHFHDDCLGGLNAFHQAGIKSFAHQQTIDIAIKNGVPASQLPQVGFRDSLVQELNGQPVIHRYFGEGHTKDNIVSYIPDQKALFGGCLIKEQGASMGFVGDANVAAWATTVHSIQQTWPDLTFVIPGHGNWGNSDLLKYTADLFKVMDAETRSVSEQPKDSLYYTILQLDSAFFEAYNRRDLEATLAFFSPGLEFYHDKGGFAGYEDTKIAMKRFYENNAENGFRRDAIPNSFEVYPVPGYGAIQINLHRFCHVEDNRLDCGIFKNMLVWKKEGESWKIAKVLSLGH